MSHRASEKLGKNFKIIRLRMNMSQGDVARALGVDRGYISNIENGQRNPTLDTIEKIAKALGVSVGEMLQ
ncbi:helix-turn-helix transcriptional regulator [Candidatus Uhrbacteria bacterium]|nr:helix-turn-helix transcriptional regulator [Candidatus Uhrbacteria bacterium]